MVPTYVETCRNRQISTFLQPLWLCVLSCPCFHVLRTLSKPSAHAGTSHSSKQPNESPNMKLLINSPFLIALLSARAAISSPHAHAHAYVRGGEGISDLRQQPWPLFTTATAKTTTKAILTSTKSAKHAAVSILL